MFVLPVPPECYQPGAFSAYFKTTYSSTAGCDVTAANGSHQWTFETGTRGTVRDGVLYVELAPSKASTKALITGKAVRVGPKVCVIGFNDGLHTYPYNPVTCETAVDKAKEQSGKSVSAKE